MPTFDCMNRMEASAAKISSWSFAAIALYALAIPTVLSGASVFSKVGAMGAFELAVIMTLVMVMAISLKSHVSGARTVHDQQNGASQYFDSTLVRPSSSGPTENAELDSEQRFSLVLRTFDIATFYCDNQHRYTWSHNFLGCPEDLIGKVDTEILPGDAAEILRGLKEKALRDGGMHDGELSFDIGTETRTFAVQVAPRRDRLGNIIGTMAVSCDVTERALWQKHLVMMMREVNHRARNLMAVVVSICGQTARSAIDVGEYKSKITGRVMSLAGSMDLVTKDNWIASSFKKLLNVQLSILPSNEMRRVRITGTDVLLKSKSVQSIGLAIHELATNASQYGALAHADGQVEINIATDNTDETPKLVLVWREVSSETILKTDKKGFGLTTLNMIVTTELNGSSEFAWHPDGIEYTLTLPGGVMGVAPDFDQSSVHKKLTPSYAMRESLTGELVEL